MILNCECLQSFVAQFTFEIAFSGQFQVNSNSTGSHGSLNTAKASLALNTAKKNERHA